jgi:ubiquinone/menaquinone biosynthesis C-methylase UbiE
MSGPVWRWDEITQIGTDYESVEEVRAYDKRMSEFRDFDTENKEIMAALGLGPDSAVLDIGAGTGKFALAAARVCRKVVCADVSAKMLEFCSLRARESGLSNMEFARAGFLTFPGECESFDAVLTSLALHHLPDLWKSAALANIHSWLKKDGLFYLQDVVFDFPPGGRSEYFERITSEFKPDSMRPSFVRHIKQEHSSENWVIRGIIERAGFMILSESAGAAAYIKRYLCRKLTV